MILDEIAARTRQRVERLKQEKPLAGVMAAAAAAAARGAMTGFPFEQALRKPGLSFICEVKKASPSKGVIAAHFPYAEIARDYEQAGAAAISVLTEPFYFQGDDHYLAEIAAAVGVPVLRKDFTVDPYQIYEARILGAAAVLLICALLDPAALAEYIRIAHSLGLSALVEAHTAAEVEMALAAGARVIGVNNRDLKTFQVDLGTSLRLRPLVPEPVLFVSESGIRNRADIAALEQAGADAVLIGEALMLSSDKARQLAILRGERPHGNGPLAESKIARGEDGIARGEGEIARGEGEIAHGEGEIAHGEGERS